MTQPQVVIFEVKITGGHPGHAIREAAGQLFEYRWFLGPRDALLCIVLDQDPEPTLLEYVEVALDLLIMWATPDGMAAGPKTTNRLESALQLVHRVGGI